MKKIFRLLIVCLLMLLATGVNNTFSQGKKQVVVNGLIENSSFSSVSLYAVGKDAILAASATIGADKKFSLVFETDKTDVYKLSFDNNNFIMMVLQPGEKVDIKSDATDLIKKLVINGSENTSDIYRNQNIITNAKIKMDSISNLSYKEMANPKYDSLLKVLMSDYEKIKTDQNDALLSYILKNPKSLAILFLLESVPVDANYDTYSKVDSSLFASHPDNFFVTNLHNQIVAGKATAIGALAPDFILPDSSGTNISLSSFRGKYVLIDFWAAWCGPCRKEMPNMIKLYKDFGGNNFEILGVSLDKTKDKWIGAINSERMTWPNVSDLKYWQSEVGAMYNVKAIPYTVLLDKEGKIIAKNLRGDELYRKVESLVK